jgi:hypothetical protein
MTFAKGRKSPGKSWQPYIDGDFSDAIRILARLAQRQNRNMSFIAKAMGRELGNFSIALRAKKPRPPLLTEFARALGVTDPLTVRALCGAVNDADEAQIHQRICFMFMAREKAFQDELPCAVNRILYKKNTDSGADGSHDDDELIIEGDTFRFRAHKAPLISEQSMNQRSTKRLREILCRFFLADQGLLEADPLEVLTQGLGLRLDDYRKNNFVDEQRKAYAGLVLMRRSLGIPAQAWLDIETILDPYMKSYPAWRAYQRLQESLGTEGQQLQEINEKIGLQAPELRKRVAKKKKLTEKDDAEIAASLDDFATLDRLTKAMLEKNQESQNAASRVRDEQEYVEKLLKEFQITYDASIGKK